MKTAPDSPSLTIARILFMFFMLSVFRFDAPALAVVNSSLSVQQQFFCSSGYDRADCQLHAAALQAILRQYPAPQIGPWNWVIVRAADWQPLLRRLHLDQRSPAFTALAQRSTYLEETLFHAEPKRAAELEGLFRLPRGQLLPMAVTHELAHAVCHEMDEPAAERIAQLIRSGAPIACESAHGLTALQQLSLHRRSPGLE